MSNSIINVSVVLAVRNEHKHIETALASILNQQGIMFEVIVVDDGSTDDTYDIVARLVNKFSNLNLYRNTGTGKCSAFNLGVQHAKGRFVCIFAGDDIMPEGSLVARWNMVKDFSDDEPVVGLCKLISMSEIKRFNGHLIPRKSGIGALSGVSPLMNRVALNKIFPVPETLPNEDTWMELAVLYFPMWNIIHSDIVGCAWRVHAGNSINMTVPFSEYNLKITARLKAYFLFYERHFADLSDKGRSELLAKIECEKNRSEGNLLGVIRSNVGFVDKLRALSITNPALYNIRRYLYGLFSGW